MKIKMTSTILIFLLFYSIEATAQFNVLDKVKKKVDRTIEKNIDKGINKTIDDAEKEIKNGPDENSEKKSNDKIEKENTDSNTQDKSDDKSTEEEKEKLQLWSKYNFVPGDKVIFADDLAGEENGEFPSRWDLIAGNAENASFEGNNIINFAQPNTAINPLMDKELYLPEIFTLEFDAYFHEMASKRQQRYSIRFWTKPNTRERYQGNRPIDPIIIDWNSAVMYNFNGKTEGETSEVRKNWEGQWVHIALSFNKRSLKIFHNESRLLNIPNLGYKPKLFSIEGFYDQKNIDVCAIKNIRLAEGGKDLYDRVISEGKFVTNGIHFEVNKSEIKPESMGVINNIVKMMEEHSDLNFSIEGHTDSDGDESSNQRLSEKRATAVKSVLVEQGIDETRFSTKGFGESIPLDSNSTSEGKANNRRVEFVKI
ncbi:MAG: OmpA family protein [Ignavibacteriae bacterium]|nr:OmpA family protein [Ignavibacteriota bacterium]